MSMISWLWTSKMDFYGLLLEEASKMMEMCNARHKKWRLIITCKEFPHLNII